MRISRSTYRTISLAVSMLVLLLLISCSFLDQSPEPVTVYSIPISITPGAETLDHGQTVTLSVTSPEWIYASLKWTVASDDLAQAGSLSSDAGPIVVYQAPLSGQGAVVVTVAGTTGDFVGTNSVCLFVNTVTPGSLSGQTGQRCPVPFFPRITASGQARNSKDTCGNTTDYSLGNLVDGQEETAWRVEGDGKDAWIEFGFDHEVTVTSFYILPGYKKRDPCDASVNWCLLHRVPEHILLQTSTGVQLDVKLSNTCQMQVYQVGPWRTNALRITILSSYPSAEEHYSDFTAISEVKLLGYDD